jgi:hypothetical protein
MRLQIVENEKRYAFLGPLDVSNFFDVWLAGEVRKPFRDVKMAGIDYRKPPFFPEFGGVDHPGVPIVRMMLGPY